MNKRDLARVLIRVIGVSMVASSVSNSVLGLVMALWTSGLSQSGFNMLGTTSVRWIADPLLQSAIGLYLFYRGGWIATSLLRADETNDL